MDRCEWDSCTVVKLSASGVAREMKGGRQRTCHIPGLAAARKRHGDDELEGEEWGLAKFSLSRMPDFMPDTKAASWPQTTSPVCSGSDQVVSK